jgi:hypothetical protein
MPYRYWRPVELCSGISEPIYEVITEQRLRISGIECCTVKEIHGTYRQGGDLVKVLASWRSAASRDAGVYATGASVQDIFCRTICLDRTEDRYPGAKNKEAKFSAEELRIFLDQITVTPNTDALMSMHPGSEALLAQLADFLDGRDFFTTADGYFGLGPGISHEGM